MTNRFAAEKLHMAQEVILRIDEEQDFRQLSEAEFSLRAKLKKRIMGWLVIERARKKTMRQNFGCT